MSSVLSRTYQKIDDKSTTKLKTHVFNLVIESTGFISQTVSRLFMFSKSVLLQKKSARRTQHIPKKNYILKHLK